MGKLLDNTILDAGLDLIAAGTKLTICNAQPTTYAHANVSYNIASIVISAGDFTGPADDTSGRKLTVNAQTSITIDSTDTATHVAIIKSVGSLLLYVTTCTSQALTAANKLNTPAFEINFRDPV